jgi:hypothetical protein
MNDDQHPSPRILVIANQTCPCPTLVDEVARRAGNPLSDVRVVAPALNSRLRHWVSDIDDAVARARKRVELAVGELRERGVMAHGEVGDSNPMLAIADALADFPATEIVIATYPPGRSNWLEHGLIENASMSFDIPVTHLISTYGLVEEAAAA